MDLGLAGAAVCILGGSKGLGRVAALEFAREGARVAVAARSRAALEETGRDLAAAGAAEVIAVPCDAANPRSIAELFARLEARWGILHTLVNMVGPTEPSPGATFLDVPDEAWQYYWDLGVMSAVRASRAAVPLMRRAGWGRIVNVSSISARIGMPFEAPYMAAKAALAALSKNMAFALAPENILVNTLTPGVYHTEALRHYMEATGASARHDPEDPVAIYRWMVEEQGARCAGRLGRIARPEEIAPLILFLGSPRASYLVGANIAADGGTDFSIP
ncbi:MAG: beta-ketoacyl-ACP reductase [Porticoccaceae bacterium]|nr:MAG: beta-ketoacyl-ACP reductase [Porticoccaceae bacterium]